jgi:hypothetical protein
VTSSDLASRLSRLADAELDALLAETAEATLAGVGHRGRMRLVMTAVVCYLNPRSRWYEDSGALAYVPIWVGALAHLQAEDGLFRTGDNLASPPDSSFTVHDVALVRQLLTATSPARGGVLARLRVELDEILARATEALVRGGVHTPNHRWEIAAALARIDALRPDGRVRARAEEWLAEGVDAAPDGLYSERSPSYDAAVSNPCLVTLAEHLDRPDLLEVVHRNLHAVAGLTDVDGSVESIHSRRQDQNRRCWVGPFALQYRRFALLVGCPACARSATLAEPFLRHGSVAALAELLAEPALAQPLPEQDAVTDPQVVVVHYPSAELVRRRQPGSSVTVYGGSDVPRQRRIASGLACNPTFLRWRVGHALLDSVRLSRNFFGLGPFRSDGLQVDEEGERGRYRLHERVTAAYYQTLPKEARRGDGRYELEHEGRYAAAMSFSSRRADEVWLETDLVVTTDRESVSVEAQLSGVETSYAYELSFEPGGVLEGVLPLAEPDCFQLVHGVGSYRVGADQITFGPGAGEDQPAVYEPGEAYTFLGGTDAKAGVRVYLTGSTPSRHTLLLQATRG